MHLLTLALWILLSPPHRDAPSVTVSGRVVRVVGGDTLAAPEAKVFLHRLAIRTRGVVDSLRTGRGGRFHFVIAPDSGDIFLVSSIWGGVEYFGPPLRADFLTTSRDFALVVSDSSSRAPVMVTTRQIVIMQPSKDGTRDVIDAITLANPGPLTRVTTSGFRANWRFPLTPYGLDFHVNDTDFSDDAFEQLGDTLFLLAPIPPGEHSFILTYLLPRGTTRVSIPADAVIGAVSVMSEESGVRVEGAFAPAAAKEVEGKEFLHWEGRTASDGSVELLLPGDGTAPSWLLPVLVGSLGIVLVVVATVAIQRRQPAPLTGAAPQDDRITSALLDQLAALDREHADGEGAREPGQWREYQDLRARLKRELQERLGGRDAGGDHQPR